VFQKLLDWLLAELIPLEPDLVRNHHLFFREIIINFKDDEEILGRQMTKVFFSWQFFVINSALGHQHKL
jgi:hypothetical protein